jgi:hypothetical protein
MKSVQVGSFIVSPNKAFLVSTPKISSDSKSLWWGDRAESEEGLPSSIFESAPPRVVASKTGEQILLAKFVCETRVKTTPIAAENDLVSAGAAVNCILGDGVLADNVSAADMLEAVNSIIVPAAIEVPSDAPAAIVQPAGSSQHLLLDQTGSQSSVAGSESGHDEVLPTEGSLLVAWQEAKVQSANSSPRVSLPSSPQQRTVSGNGSPFTPRGTGDFLGGRYSQAEVLAFGGIPTAGIRSSERIKKQPNADAMQLERAQGVALQRDQAMDSGNSKFSMFTLASFSNESIIDRASKLGGNIRFFS